MPDDTFLARVLPQLGNIWDVIASLGGAGAGAFFHVRMGMDPGTAAGTGALAAASVRRAIAATFRGRTVRKRAERLKALLQLKADLEASAPPDDATDAGYYIQQEPKISASTLLAKVNRLLEMWNAKAIDVDKFETLFKSLQDNYAELKDIT